MDGDAASGGIPTSVVAAMEATGREEPVACCCGNNGDSVGYSVEAPGNGVSENVAPSSGVALGVYFRVRRVVEPTLCQGTVASSVNGVMRVVAEGTVVTPSSENGVSVTETSVVAMVSHGDSVVVGCFLSKAHLSVLLPRSKVQLKELLASLPSRNVTTA